MRENFLTRPHTDKKSTDDCAACVDVVQILGMESETLWEYQKSYSLATSSST
jgi:hypothetical protein